MKKIIVLSKKEGETPLEALEFFRGKNKKYKDAKMTYAGRLDPMASGLLIILAGEETKNKEKYLALGKEYEFEVLFGFTTDTYDILGKVVSSKKYDLNKKILEESIKQNLKYFTGKFIQKYPVYSSKNIKKVRAGKSVKASSREVFIKDLKFLKLRTINDVKLSNDIKKRILKVSGDFRQKEILKLWQKHLQNSMTKYAVASFKIKCSSGTYVRGIAHELGKSMGVPALAFSIKRTKIGKWGKISI